MGLGMPLTRLSGRGGKSSSCHSEKLPPKWLPGPLSGDLVVPGGRARGRPWLSGLRPDAVSRMRLRALVGGGGIAGAGWRGVFPDQDSFCFTGRGSAL